MGKIPSSVVGIPFLRGIRLCSLKLPCALLVFKHVMCSYVIVWRSFINNYWCLGWYNIKKVPGNLFAELLNLALATSEEWLFYINYCVIVSKRIIMSIMVSNTKRLLYKDPPTRDNRHVHRLFTCSNSPNVEARASTLLVGTSKQVLLQPYERLQMMMSAAVQPF